MKCTFEKMWENHVKLCGITCEAYVNTVHVRNVSNPCGIACEVHVNICEAHVKLCRITCEAHVELHVK